MLTIVVEQNPKLSFPDGYKMIRKQTQKGIHGYKNGMNKIHDHDGHEGKTTDRKEDNVSDVSGHCH